MTSIAYRTRACTLGRLLVAATPRGVCYVRLGGGDPELRRHLEGEFPYAAFEQVGNGAVKRWSDTIARYVDGGSGALDVPLDVRGSAFQRRVWAALRRIPRGETRTYGEVARRLGAPHAARAVARACGANPVPVLTPCHRVVPKAGGVGGYALGAERKRALLLREGAPVA